VLSAAEARERVKGKPWSFLHISKPEIDLDPGIDPYDRAVYAKAAENLERMIAAGILTRDRTPCYYVYRLTWRNRAQTGLGVVASIAAYDSNRIRRHEYTTPVKEDDRVRQIEAVNAQTGPVMLAYPEAREIDALLARASDRAPDEDAMADDGVRHELWVISEDTAIRALTQAVDELPALYICDGHHRSAAASRVAARRQAEPATAITSDGARIAQPGLLSTTPESAFARCPPLRRERAASYRHFLAVLFPHHQMTILDYNRVVRDLNGRSADALLAELRERFSIAAGDQPVNPAAAWEFGMFIAGSWYRLTLRPDLVPQGDPIERLPVTLLARQVLEPILNITDQRTDKRLDFVGGARGHRELERLVSSGGMAAAFALFPTQMADLMAVADAGGIMPPKSTWFEPKLADGMVNHVLDGDEAGRPTRDG
jgi:uncharacterized protein (DUF1015 family)